MDIELKKEEEWKDFESNYRRYITALSDIKNHDIYEGTDKTYDSIIKEWAKYLAVNKTYVLGGPRYVKEDIGKQMLYLISRNHSILENYLDIYYYGYKKSTSNKVQDFSKLMSHVKCDIEFEEQVRREIEEEIKEQVKREIEEKEVKEFEERIVKGAKYELQAETMWK